MKITKSQLKQIIKEELQDMLETDEPKKYVKGREDILHWMKRRKGAASKKRSYKHLVKPEPEDLYQSVADADPAPKPKKSKIQTDWEAILEEDDEFNLTEQ